MKVSILNSILVQLLVVSVQGQIADPCSGLGKRATVSYDDALACYNNIKLTDEVRTKTIDTLRKALPFYAFVDISKKAPDYNVPSQVDIDAELVKIGKQNFKSEQEFHTTLTKFYNTLHDGHTRYTSCFSTFGFNQPFPLYTIVDKNGATVVKVVEELDTAPSLLNAWKALGVDVNSFAGKQVLRINGHQPLEYIEKYANEYIGTSRDINSRINYALARVIRSNRVWGLNNGAFKATNIPPADKSLTFTFREGTEEKSVEVPYLVTVPRTLNSTEQLYNFSCKRPTQQANIDLNQVDFQVGTELETMMVPEVVAEKVDSPLPQSDDSRLGSTLTTPLIDGQYATTYLIKNNTVGVMTINTFSADRTVWYNEVFSGFKALKEAKIEKIILDLSNNGGGTICWGYYIMEYLFPNAAQTYFNTDMHSTPLLRDLVRIPGAGFFTPRSYRDPNGKLYTSNNDWDPIQTFVRGTNRDSTYTPLFQDSCTANFLKPLFNADNSAPFKKENIALVTNSVCYSTCTLVSNGMQEFHNIDTYAVGGLKDKKSTVASIAGGTVYALDSLLFALKNTGLDNHPDAPQPLPTLSSLRFTVREAYSSKKYTNNLRPLEFSWLPAKNKIHFNQQNVFDPSLIWDQIANKW